MKFLAVLFLTAITASLIYFKGFKFNKKNKAINWKALSITGIFALIILGLWTFGIYISGKAPDTQCTTTHKVNSIPPNSLTTYKDYFSQGNYDYDIGNCQKAITDYTNAINLNPNYPEAYNNRGYTYMRMQQYVKALPDFNKAIEIRPDYIQALMNQGDLYNYYGPIIDRKKAIVDYQKVISLGGINATSVCGHLFLARHNGWNLGTILAFLQGGFLACY